MAESFCRVGDIDICYETFGDPADPAMLLIMGLGTQMLAWHEDFCTQLAERGFFVIRHDNRDIGRSTRLRRRADADRWCSSLDARHARAPPTRWPTWRATASACSTTSGSSKAHIVGASMGGMIAQTIAIRYPQRTLSLVSIMSNTGGFWNGQPALTMYAVLLKPSPRDRDGVHRARRRDVHQDRRLGLRARRRGPARHRHAAATTAGTTRAARSASWRRSSPTATARPLLRRLTVPATVIHGAEDKLVRPSGGRATAKAIPGAQLVDDRRHGPRPAARRLADRSSARSPTTAGARAAAPALTPARG